jgi:hypothetical protein
MKPASAKLLFLAALASQLVLFAAGSIRNPRGIADSSPWNHVEFAVFVLAFGCAVASPFLTDKSLRAKLFLSLAAAAAYVLLVTLLVVVHLLLFGLPVR